MHVRSLVRRVGRIPLVVAVVALVGFGGVARAQVTAKTLIGKAVSDDSEYKVETHPLNEIRRLADEWQERAVDAAAASQLDPSWLALSSATSNIAELQTALETAREAGFSGDRFWTQSVYTISDLNRHVAAIGDFEAQCKGLLARL